MTSVVSSEALSIAKAGAASKIKGAKRKPAQKSSKRGANEDSEVRYDKKHKIKAAESSTAKRRKKDADVAAAEEASPSGTDDVAGDEATIISGNEDDRGSVVSAILDEDICYECGGYTLDGDEWNSVILCDLCEGEYHLHCQGLKATPEGSFMCRKCNEDEKYYKDLRFDVSSSFKVLQIVS